MDQSEILYIAVKALIKNDEGKVLVLKQSDSTITGVNQYHPPGGIIEFGESLADCVAREVEEEVGVQAIVGKLYDVGEWKALRNQLKMQFVGLFYVCELTSNELSLQKSEVSEFFWVGPDTIDSIDILEPSKSIIKRFLKDA